MRRLALAAVLLATLGVTPAAAEAPGRMLVTADEWSLVASRQSLASGKAIVQLANGGEDAHDLALQRIGGKGRPVVFPETRPGEVSTQAVKLRPGRYRLWCTLLGHAKAGMRATIRVR